MMYPESIPDELENLKLQVERLQMALGALISWMSQSANSPIRRDEANTLIEIMQQGWKGTEK